MVAPDPINAVGQGSILDLDRLTLQLCTRTGPVALVEDLSLTVPAGTTAALVGESGCGKTVTALAVMRLLPPEIQIAEGRILLGGVDLTSLPERRMRHLRGNDIAMVFQEPGTSLNPVFTLGNQIAEAVRLHQRVGRAEADRRAVEMLRRVRMPDPQHRARQYPHEVSGGMKQRAMIAMALACDPAVLIADEPTTALDVTIQAQILDLLSELQRTTRMAVLLITHDLGIVADMARQVAVMYAGRIVEQAPVGALFGRPLHPYTVGLFQSLPRPDQKLDRLREIPGTVPPPGRFPSGCRFRTRCAFAVPQCAELLPPLEAHEPNHRAACLRVSDLSASGDVGAQPSHASR